MDKEHIIKNKEILKKALFDFEPGVYDCQNQEYPEIEKQGFEAGFNLAVNLMKKNIDKLFDRIKTL